MQDFNKQLKELDKLAKKAAKELEKSAPDWIDIPGIIDHRYRVIFDRDVYVGVQSEDAFSAGYADLFLFTKEQWDTVKSNRMEWSSDNCTDRLFSHMRAKDLKKSKKWCARKVRQINSKDQNKDCGTLRTLAFPIFLLLVNMTCCVIWLTLGGSEGSILKSFTGVVYLLVSCSLSVSLYVRYENS